jgi:hypothetical protein
MRRTIPGSPDLLKRLRREDLSPPDRAAGEEVLDTDLAHISPLAFGHIRPNGTYWFDRDLQAADGSQVFNGTRAARIEGVNVAYDALE